jgi:hypothetical protein
MFDNSIFSNGPTLENVLEIFNIYINDVKYETFIGSGVTLNQILINKPTKIVLRDTELNLDKTLNEEIYQIFDFNDKIWITY